MAEIALIALAGAIGLALYLYRYHKQWTKTWFYRIAGARKVIWTVFLLAFAMTLLASGSPIMVLGAAGVVAYAVLYLLFEQPLRPIRQLIGI